ncbi:MAG: CobW family GTP-binding protein [Lachnospiraceae bacterium]
MSKLYLITGFLGAGKTTFLKNFIQELSEYRLHLIINEFGKEGMDGQLLRGLGMALDEINNGSIFCSCRLDKFEEVLQTALKQNPDIIIVEASGLSNPIHVRKILAQSDKFQDLEYSGCICLVDAKQFKKVYATATVVKKQISISDVILLNKVDLVTEEEVVEVRNILVQHRPDIPIFETTYGNIRREWIIDRNSSSLEEELPEIQKMDITLRKGQIYLQDTFTYYRFQKFLEMFLEDTYRVKGFVNLDGQTYFVDCVGDLFKATPYEGKVDHINVLVVLSGNGLPTRKKVKEAVAWYPDDVKEVSW